MTQHVSDGSSNFISAGYNVSSDDDAGYLNGPGDQINTDPMLGPLQDSGGPIFTQALLPGSPAIDAGDTNFAPSQFYDQRGPGFDRVRGSHLDIGSFEVQATPTPTSTPTFTPRVTPHAEGCANSEAASLASAPPVAVVKDTVPVIR
jgi:hypothetical protein